MQVAHPSVREHLLALIYMGFLVPVLGPALTQVNINIAPTFALFKASAISASHSISFNDRRIFDSTTTAQVIRHGSVERA